MFFLLFDVPVGSECRVTRKNLIKTFVLFSQLGRARKRLVSDKKQDTYKSRRRVVVVDAGHRQPPQVDLILIFYFKITSICLRVGRPFCFF